MAANWPKLPALDSPDELGAPLPPGWRLEQIEKLYEQLPIGKRFDQKSSCQRGTVPVIDQSATGIIGWHDNEPGVMASAGRPVVTFANHTCEMRWMLRPFSLIQNVFPLVGKPDVCNTRFFYYGTKGRVHLEEYKGHFPDFRRKWIPVPPLPEQRAIAHILGTLDDKIELNRRMSETLEAMARALFKSWFVDFDPVRAKAEGRDPGLSKELADLFPDSFVDSELGEIPSGWKAGSFRAIASQRTERAGVRNVVVLSAIAAGELVRSDEHFNKRVYSKETDKYLVVEKFDVAYNPSRINIGSVGMLDENLLGAVSPVYVVARPKAPYHWFLSFSLRLPSTRATINTLASGSVRQSLSFYDFSSIPSVIPPPRLVEEFNRRWIELRDSLRARQAESDTLAGLRDELLPRLISGSLRVNDSEAFLSRLA